MTNQNHPKKIIIDEIRLQLLSLEAGSLANDDRLKEIWSLLDSVEKEIKW